MIAYPILEPYRDRRATKSKSDESPIFFNSPANEEAYAIFPLFGKLGLGLSFKISLPDAHEVRKYRWYLSEQGYAMTYLPRGPMGQMRVAVLHVFLIGDIPSGNYIDHRNRDRLDYRRSNLRVCSPSVSAQNTKSASKLFAYKGVRKAKQKSERFCAQITVNLKPLNLGTYDTAEDAARAYDAAARFYFGPDALTNFLGSETKDAVTLRAETKTRLDTRKVPYAGLARRKGSNWRVYFAGKYYGSFIDPEEAARKYDDVRASMGYPRVNFPDL